MDDAAFYRMMAQRRAATARPNTGAGFNQGFGGSGVWQDGMGRMRVGFASPGGMGRVDPFAGKRAYKDPRSAAELGGDWGSYMQQNSPSYLRAGGRPGAPVTVGMDPFAAGATGLGGF